MSEKTKNLTAVIMAGGKGIRLSPLTDNIPKPLLSIGTKPILELLICKLRDERFKKIIITTGYKGRMIEAYFKNGSQYGVDITYTRENKPLGTVGALTLISRKIAEPFLVINGDILTDQNLAVFMEFHIESGASITVGIRKHQEKVSFGVINRDGSILREIEEKPKLYFDIGAGIYAISPQVIEEIPQDTFFDFPDLVKKIQQHQNIKCYEIKGFWKDIGRWEDYEELNHNVTLLQSLDCYNPPSPEEPSPPPIKIPIASPNISLEEAQACFSVVLSGFLNEGKKVEAFENKIRDYVGCNHAIAFFNGTVALHSLLLALGISHSEDEVIVPSLTFVSTATTVLHAGGRPVFADIDPYTLNIAPEDTEARISEKTKAIVVVHYAGQPADIDRFIYLAEKYKLYLIEDAAEALGAEYDNKKVGSFGIAGMFSFTPTKNITTGEGGIITTNDGYLARQLRLLKNHGSSDLYHHVVVGYNYRMTEMQGAIGIAQMEKLPGILKRKEEMASYFSGKLKNVLGIIPPFHAKRRKHTYMMFTVRIDPVRCPLSRAEIMKQLFNMGIQTKIYFPPLHKQPIFSQYDIPSPLSVTDAVADTIFSLPMHSQLEYEQIDYIVESLKSIIVNGGSVKK